MTVPATPKYEHTTAADIAASELAATCAAESWNRSRSSSSLTVLSSCVMSVAGMVPQPGQVALDDVVAVSDRPGLIERGGTHTQILSPRPLAPLPGQLSAGLVEVHRVAT